MATKKDTREALNESVYKIVEAKLGVEATAKLYRVKGVKSNMLYTEYLVKDYSQETEKQEIQKAVKRVIDLNNGSNCIAFTKSDGKPALIRINGANVNS
jgi:hypothetical protein